jgi:hypothetical protein
MTILFMLLFGRWGQSEMNWYGNETKQNRIRERESKWLPTTIIIDLALLIIFYCW